MSNHQYTPPPAETEPPAKAGDNARAAAERLCRLFEGNERAHGTHGVPVRDGIKWGIKTTAKTVEGPATVELWMQHLAGQRALGVIPIREDSSCCWGCIDVDKYDDEAELFEVVSRVKELKLPLVACRSKSGGLHLFLFLLAPAPAADVREGLKNVAAKLGYPKAEIFPKQDRIDAGRGEVGNWMVMPYFGGTFGGKLREQVGLKPNGSGLTGMAVAESLDAAETTRAAPGLLAGEAGEAGPRPAARPRAAVVLPFRAPPAGSPFSDGPPCLQRLAVMKVERGAQSNFLMGAGTYFKFADPANWKERLKAASQNFLDPPGTPDGLRGVTASLEKKDYEYACKTEPLCSHCASDVCRTRRFGVGGGGGGNFPEIESIRVVTSGDDPLAFIMVLAGGLEVEFDKTEDILSYDKFIAKCAAVHGLLYLPMKKATWHKILQEPFSRREVVAATEGVGNAAHFDKYFFDYLTDSGRATSPDLIATGKPWLNPENNRHYFKLQGLYDFVIRRAAGTPLSKETSRWMAKQVRRLKGNTDYVLRINAQWTERCCWMPRVEPRPRLSLPPEKEQAI